MMIFSAIRQKVGAAPTDDGQSDFAGSGNIASLDHRPMDWAKKTVTHGLRQCDKCMSKKLRAPFVDAFAQVGIVLVRRAE